MSRMRQTAWLRALVVGAILLLLVAAASPTQAARQPAALATLTLGKATQPTGGTDFPLTVVGHLFSFTTTLRSPRDIEQDSNGTLYVISHQSHRLDRFDADGAYLGSWGERGEGDGQFFRPDDLAIHESGETVVIYVADSENDRIQKLDADGNFLGKWGRAGTGPGQFGKPQGLAVDVAGNVYVADTTNHRIQKFDPNGNFLAQWGREGIANGEFSYPSGIDIAPNGDLYIVDSNNHRIQVLDSQGRFLRAWGRHGDKAGQLNLPSDLTLDDDGFVLVADTYNHRIQKFSLSGRYLSAWGSRGTGPSQFERPNGILVTPDGKTYVLDIDSADIRVFQQTTAYLDDGEQQPIQLPEGSYRITEAPDANWELADVDCDGGGAGPVAGGVDLMLQEGETVSCTFNGLGSNTQVGALTGFIYHDMDLDRAYGERDTPLANWPTWLLDTAGLQIGSQQRTGSDGRAVFSNLAPGTYQICTQLPVGWYNNAPGYNGPIAGTGANLCLTTTVSPGVNTMMRFGQVQAANLIIRKEVIPEDQEAAFTFTSAIASLSGVLRHGQSAQATIFPGTHQVREIAGDGDYELTAIRCDDTDSEGVLSTRTATFRSAPGERILCVFTSQMEAGEPGSLNFFVYHDTDRGGSYGDGDRALSGWTTRVRSTSGTQIGEDATSNGNGRALFAEVPAGPLRACVVVPAGWVNTEPGDENAHTEREVCRDVVVVAGARSDAHFGHWTLSHRLYTPAVVR